HSILHCTSLTPPRPSSILTSTPPLPPRSTLFPYTTLFRSKIRCSTSRTIPPDTWWRFRSSPEASPGSGRWCKFDGDKTRSRSARSEEHTSELQSLAYLVCRLLLEKKKQKDERDDAATS